MADERKQAEGTTAVAYIENEWGEAWLRNEWQAGDVVDALQEFAALKVAETTKEMYPKAFIEWKDMYVQFYAYGNTYHVRSIDKHFVGLELLFEYWKQNIQGK